MGIKTTVNNKGVVTESTSGSTIQFIVDGKKINKTVTADVDADITLDNKPVAVVEANGAIVTASLPTLSADLVGLEYTVVNADQTNTFVLSGTNPIDAGTWELEISASRCAAVIAVTSSAGLGWSKLFGG